MQTPGRRAESNQEAAGRGSTSALQIEFGHVDRAVLAEIFQQLQAVDRAGRRDAE
jgi:hypothetical protein